MQFIIYPNDNGKFRESLDLIKKNNDIVFFFNALYNIHF